MNFDKKEPGTYFISIACLYLVCAGNLFVHQSNDNMIWFSDCETQESPSRSMCALMCVKSQICLNFAYNKTINSCEYNCKVFWSRQPTDDGQIYYERKSKNLALLKPGSSSSVLDNNNHQFPVSAVDGVLSPLTTGRYCYHSETDGSDNISPWIQIDLQTITEIDYLKIFNRWDDLGYRLHDIKVQLDDVDGNCDYYIGPAADSEVVFIPCQPAARGRYVKVLIDGSPGEHNVLTVCELEIRQFN